MHSFPESPINFNPFPWIYSTHSDDFKWIKIFPFNLLPGVQYITLRTRRMESYHKPNVFEHCHRFDKHVLLMHEAAVTSHV